MRSGRMLEVVIGTKGKAMGGDGELRGRWWVAMGTEGRQIGSDGDCEREEDGWWGVRGRVVTRSEWIRRSGEEEWVEAKRWWWEESEGEVRWWGVKGAVGDDGAGGAMRGYGKGQWRWGGPRGGSARDSVKKKIRDQNTRLDQRAKNYMTEKKTIK